MQDAPFSWTVADLAKERGYVWSEDVIHINSLKFPRSEPHVHLLHLEEGDGLEVDMDIEVDVDIQLNAQVEELSFKNSTENARPVDGISKGEPLSSENDNANGALYRIEVPKSGRRRPLAEKHIFLAQSATGNYIPPLKETFQSDTGVKLDRIHIDRSLDSINPSVMKFLPEKDRERQGSVDRVIKPNSLPETATTNSTITPPRQRVPPDSTSNDINLPLISTTQTKDTPETPSNTEKAAPVKSKMEGRGKQEIKKIQRKRIGLGPPARYKKDPTIEIIPPPTPSDSPIAPNISALGQKLTEEPVDNDFMDLTAMHVVEVQTPIHQKEPEKASVKNTEAPKVYEIESSLVADKNDYSLQSLKTSPLKSYTVKLLLPRSKALNTSEYP